MKTPVIICLISLLALMHFSLISIKAFRTPLGWEEWLADQPHLAELVERYTEVTVMQADYSFFSPDVAADLKVLAMVQDSAGRHTVDPFDVANPEVKTRFLCSVLCFQNVPEVQELIARSWAARVYEKFPAAQSVSVRGLVYHLPTMREYRQGNRPYYQRMFEITFSTSQGR
jgi:hypothetical protein